MTLSTNNHLHLFQPINFAYAICRYISAICRCALWSERPPRIAEIAGDAGVLIEVLRGQVLQFGM